MPSLRAHDFIQKVLTHRQGGVEALIQLSGNAESDWLEFKDSLFPRDGRFEKDKAGRSENKADYQWNVAEAIIALANSYGGAVLIGIAEDKETNSPQTKRP